ncbi:MAG: HD domain-containing protein [Planctomycetia bacterium]|jgi:3'-5' exoribonuclease|nr:HD domain-containing protein [Planctomycetia bacterium]MCC7314437.1 HD domain-containing protein [Planctomycetota bacterium]
MAIGKTTEPSPRRFIDQLQPGEQVADQVFLIAKKDLRTTTNGGLYIHLVLADRTGQLLGRIWSATQAQYDTIPEGGFLRIRGRTESYKGALQFIVDGMKPAQKNEVEVGDFIPSSAYDVDKMWARMLEILRTIKHPSLLALIKQFVKDEGIVSGYKKAPAAVANHHAFVGGLLEHTLSLMEMATRILGATDEKDSHYPQVSRDLVLAGLFLHDIGKTVELTYDTNFTYTSPGQLVGHIVQASIWIDRKAAEVEDETGQPFPADLQNLLTHIVLSHHGQYEFGSPKLPACPEAILIHYLDNIDAKLNMAFSAIRDARNAESDWTEWVKPLETRIYKKDVLSRETPND